MVDWCIVRVCVCCVVGRCVGSYGLVDSIVVLKYGSSTLKCGK